MTEKIQTPTWPRRWPLATHIPDKRNLRYLFHAAPSLLREILSYAYPVEWLTLAYLIFLNGITLICHRRLPFWKFHLLIHTGIVTLILAVAWLERRASHRVLRFTRWWLPMLLFIVFFEEIHYTVHAIFPGWFDSVLIAADYALCRVHPTVWLQQHASLWLTEYMNFSYTSYFVLAPILGGVLYYRKEWRSFQVLILGTAIAYYICYLTFLFWPIEGPYHTLRHLHTVELEGWIFTALINWIEGWGRIHGGAFPSAHVAGSFVVLLCAYRFTRGLFWVLLPVVLSLFVSTVYGRYHYVSDVLGGVVAGWIGTALAFRYGRLPDGRIAYRD